MKKRYIVKVDDINKTTEKMIGKKKIRTHKELQCHVFELNDAELADLLADKNSYEYIELDGEGQGFSMPDDPGISNQWYLPKVNVINAWGVTNGDPTLTIAHLDTGLDFAHPEFAGRANIVKGRDYVNSDDDPTDDHGHGTATLGIISAAGHNGLGIAGIAMNCRVIVYKVLSASNWGSYSNWAAAIRAAADAGAKIISMSMGGTTSSITLQSAVDYAWGKGAIVVVAAGNNGNDSPTYPAACNNVLAISSIESEDSFSGWSTWGSFVDFCCYGGGIYTTNIGGGYANWSGTSFACPMFAATLALIWSIKRSLTAQQLIDFVKKNCVNLGDPLKFGAGKPDAYKTINDILGIAPPPPNDTMFSDAGLQEIGLNEFRRLHPAITGNGVKVLQVEWPEGGGGWAPPNATYLPTGVTPVIGYHASEVAKVIKLIAPGATLLSSNASWFESTFGVSPPISVSMTAEWGVENHSYTANYNFSNNAICQAQDERLVRDSVVSYGACGNSEGEVTRIWNSSRGMDLVGGYATPKGDYYVWDKSYQTYPDIYAPTQWSSIASPVLAGCAALLMEIFPTRKQEVKYALERSRVNTMVRIDIALQLLNAGTVTKPDPDPLYDQVPPSVPTGLTAAPHNATHLKLSWNASTDNKSVLSYRIYENGVIRNNGVNQTYGFCGLPPAGTTASFQVRAVDSSGNVSALSEALIVDSSGNPVTSPPPPPTETWTPFTTVIQDWYVTQDWSPDPINYDIGQVFTQTRTLERQIRTGEVSNLGNERNVQNITEQKTESRDAVGTKPAVETWTPFTTVVKDWYVIQDWSPPTSQYYTNETFAQTRTLQRDLEKGQISNLGNKKDVVYSSEQKTESRTAQGTKERPNMSDPINLITQPGVSWSARGEHPTSGFGPEGIAQLFDGNKATKWLDFAKITWVRINLPNAATLKSYDITSANDAPQRDPKNWSLYGSNDGVAWTLIETVVAPIWASRFEKKSFSVSSTAAYKHFKFDLECVSGDINQLAELVLFGVVNSEPVEETWAALREVSSITHSEWEPSAELYFVDESVNQTRTKTTIWKNYEKSNLGNERNVSFETQTETENQTVSGLKSRSSEKEVLLADLAAFKLEVNQKIAEFEIRVNSL